MHEFQQDDPPDDDISLPGAGDPAAASREIRLAALDAEFTSWKSMDVPARNAALREVIARKREAIPEVMVRLCCQAHDANDRSTLNLAFEALAKLTMAQLIASSRQPTPEAREDHAQSVLLKTFEAI